MRITYDPAKRDWTLRERQLDFEAAAHVFAGPVFEAPDTRFAYGEERIVTFGRLHGRMVVVVWTARGDARHIISMRNANDREQARHARRLTQAS
jgi:uncharacterized DUF497 family protein